MSNGLENLQVWQEAMHFVEKIYRLAIPALPIEERFALREQLQRATQSIPANLAEGYGRYHYPDQIRFCYIARGSAEEVYTYLTIAYRLNYLDEATYQELNTALQTLKRLINGYIRFLRSQQHHKTK